MLPFFCVVQDHGYCIVGVEPTYLPSQNGQPLWILGDIFLRSYSVYDMAKTERASPLPLTLKALMPRLSSSSRFPVLQVSLCASSLNLAFLFWTLDFLS